MDVLVISETKLDDSFPIGQFKIPGYSSPFRLDRNQKGGGIMVLVREDIPVKILSFENKPIEAFFFELNFHKKKWLIGCSYNSNKNTISAHLEALRKSLDLYSAHYENITLLGDFNVSISDQYMESFCESYNFKSLIKDPTCFKNPENPSCIDLIITNNPHSFRNSCVIETGLSDFHKMIDSVIKTTFQKLKPKIIHYRDYKDFSNESFRVNLLNKLSLENLHTDSNGLGKFLQICNKTLDKEAPQKKKYIRGNNVPFYNKELSSAHKKRTYLKNRFLKKRSLHNKYLYNRQRNFCVSLLKKIKKEYYANLNPKDLADNKQFWRTVKPLLSDKSKSSEKIILVENNEIINEDKDNAELLNSFFSSAVKDLKIPEFGDSNALAENISHPIFKPILKYDKHPSIVAIKKASCGAGFYFSEVSVREIFNEINNLNARKAAQNTDIPVKILKENIDIFSAYICEFFNATIRSSKFPSTLKNADITAVFKKGFKGSKENYRPVSILPTISKLFEKIISRQVTNFMDPLLSKYQCGFRKGFSAQNCLLTMLEKWKSSVDRGKSFGLLLTDLSKAFDCLSHELLIAKLNAYGFSLPALKLMQSYLSERKQRTKINQSYSSWEEILFGVPQGSILGPILFNIFLSDLFLVVQNVDFASYADDNTIYSSAENIDEVIFTLQESSKKLFKWFTDNQMKSNNDKCHLIVSTNEPVEVQIGECSIKNSSKEKLLGVTIDSKLNFDDHVNHLCGKANQKLRALARATPYMTQEKKKLS